MVQQWWPTKVILPYRCPILARQTGVYKQVIFKEGWSFTQVLLILVSHMTIHFLRTIQEHIELCTVGLLQSKIRSDCIHNSHAVRLQQCCIKHANGAMLINVLMSVSTNSDKACNKFDQATFNFWPMTYGPLWNRVIWANPT